MNKLTGFEIETLSGSIERRTVFIYVYFPINRAFFVQIRSYLLAKSEIIIWWCREFFVSLRR